jgi:hypothetical protein
MKIINTRFEFLNKTSQFEQYVTNKEPKSVADVDKLVSEYFRNQQSFQ